MASFPNSTTADGCITISLKFSVHRPANKLALIDTMLFFPYLQGLRDAYIEVIYSPSSIMFCSDVDVKRPLANYANSRPNQHEQCSKLLIT